jgi:hypothetical protein
MPSLGLHRFDVPDFRETFCRRPLRGLIQVDHSFESAEQRGTRGAKLRLMSQRKLAQKPFAAYGQPQQDLPAIRLTASAAQQAFCFHPIHQLDGAVMLNLQPLCKHADGRAQAHGQTLDREKSLMLSRRDAGSAGSPLAEIQKAADFISTLREDSIIHKIISVQRLYRIAIYKAL